MRANLLYRPAVTFYGGTGVAGEPCCVRPRPFARASEQAQGGVPSARDARVRGRLLRVALAAER